MSTNRPLVLHAPAHLTTLSRSFSVIVPSDPYIIGLTLLPSSTSTSTYVVSTSPPSSAIYLYTPSATGLTQTLSLSIGGNGPTTTRAVPNFGGRPALLSSQQHNGCVKVWDERQGKNSVLEFLPPKNRGILSFDVSLDGLSLAAGTDLQYDDASIFYWDPRNSARLQHTHSSTHSDDITALHFHPTRADVLLSASTDGLLSTSDALETDEDETVQAIANWGCSISRTGWTADNRIWAASDMETFGIWNSDLDLVNDFGDVRRPALPGSRWTTDYLIDVVEFSHLGGPCGVSGLTAFLGSNSGDLAFASMTDLQEHGTDAPTWTMRALLRHGHADVVVRSVVWDNVNGLLVSGDEAGRLTAWRPGVDQGTDIEMVDVSVNTSRGGGGTKRGREDGQDDVRMEDGFGIF